MGKIFHKLYITEETSNFVRKVLGNGSISTNSNKLITWNLFVSFGKNYFLDVFDVSCRALLAGKEYPFLCVQ